MLINPLRVLKLAESVRTGAEPRITVPKGTRVVVVNTKDNVITVRVHSSAGEKLAKTRLIVTETQVEQTFRGRPRKS